ncbi:MAG: alpha/beta hydrolase-fold protein [Planctomycetota bacterium]|jgi:pullulanase
MNPIPNFNVTLCAALSLATVTPVLGATTTFSVEVPEWTPEGDTVYVAGDFQGWNPGNPSYALTEQPDDRWEITLEFNDGQPIQFKFTRGSWATVEKGPNGEEIANRTHTPVGVETLQLTVANWADPPSTIVGHVEWFEHPPFLSGRRCWVYLPPDYFESTQSYPVLYMHDGQNLFDVATSFAGEWEVDEACEELIANCEIEPIIVVGIENGPNRCLEYTPWQDPSPPGACPTGGGGGDAYLQAVRDILLPEVNQRYRTKIGSEHTYMSGSSLGGLISVYAGYEYDDVWGRMAGVSPSYGWADDEMFNYASAQTMPENLSRFYQDMGTNEFGFIDTNNNGVDDFIDDLRAMRDIALAQGFEENENFLSVEAQGHAHNEFFWAQRVPDLLRFLVDPPVICSGDNNAVPAASNWGLAVFMLLILTVGSRLWMTRRPEA